MVNPTALITDSKLYKFDPFHYARSLLISTTDLLCEAKMAKGQTGNRKEIGRGKKLQTTQTAGTSKRGRNSNKKILENIADLYDSFNQVHIRETIEGQKRQSDDEDDDLKEQETRMDFISNPGNTRGRFSLFQQSVKTYWKFKCVLAKAMLSMLEKEVNSSMLFELQLLKQDIREMSKAHIQANDRIGRIEHQLQSMQQAQMPGSTAKDPTPVDSLDG